MTDDFAEAEWIEEPPVSRISARQNRLGRRGVPGGTLCRHRSGRHGYVEDGSTTEAEIESDGQTADGELIDPEKNFSEVYGARTRKTIVSLRAKIAEILAGLGIAVLPAEECRPFPMARSSSGASSFGT